MNLHVSCCRDSKSASVYLTPTFCSWTTLNRLSWKKKYSNNNVKKICLSSFNVYWCALLQTVVTRNKIVARLLFMLLKDFVASARLQRVHKNFLPKSVVHYLCHLKSNNIIGQRKTTNKEKHFYPWLTSFNLKLSCT